MSNPTTVSSGATLTISSGTTSSGLVVLSGGTVNVLSGGTTTATVISAGGIETVSSGGVALGDAISAGTETVAAGGVASGAMVPGGTLTVSGGTATGTTVGVGGTENLYAGTTVGDVITDNGFEIVENFNFGSMVAPVASNALVESGGYQLIFRGSTVNETVARGGRQFLQNGTAFGTTISSGGTQSIGSDGTATNDTLLSGGTVSDGGALLFTELSGSTVTLGGTLTDGGTITNSGTGTLVLSAVVASSGFTSGFTGGITIAGGTVELTSAGAAGTGPIGFNAGTFGLLRIDGTVAPTNSISGLVQSEAIDLGGLAYGSVETVAVSGTTVTVTSGANRFALTVADAASDGIFILRQAADGSTLLTDTRPNPPVVPSGMSLAVGSSLTSSGVVVLSGGVLDVLSGGTSISAAVAGQVVVLGGVDSAATVSSGGSEIVSAGGVGIAETLGVGASATVSSGGTVRGATLTGGTLTVSGGTASGTLVTAGSFIVSGGTAFATTVGSGASESVYLGTTIGDVISGGSESIDNFNFGSATMAVASNALIGSGGVQTVHNGITVNETIAGGGRQYIFTGAASGTTISSGALQSLGPAVTATNDTLLSGGTVSNAGLLLFTEAAGSTVTLGGNLTGSGGVVNSGAGMLVLSAAVMAPGSGDGFIGGVTVAGGTVELTSAGAAGTGGIGFAVGTSGTLRIDGATAPANAISGLLQADAIDFGGLAYNRTAETVAVSGTTVTITSGTSAFALTIPDTAVDGVFSLRPAADGSTLLTDTRGGSTTVSSGATLSVGSGITSSGLIVLSGGALTVLSGGTVASTTVAGLAVLSGGLASATTLSSGGIEIVSAGGVGVGETVRVGATETVSSGGAVSGATVSGGGLTISGGTASGTQVLAGTFTVSAGTASATTVALGASESVNGGTTVGDVISGGSETIGTFAFGSGSMAVASNGLVESFGQQTVFTGSTVNETVAIGGKQTIFLGTVSATTISSGGTQSVGSSGTALNDTVLRGGTVSNGGTLLFTEAAGSTVTLGGMLAGTGAVVNSGAGTLVLAAATTSQTVSGNTASLVVAAGTVELTSAVAAGAATIGFGAGTSGTLRIDGTATPANPISGLYQGDAIDLAGVAYNSAAEAVAVSGTTVTVTSGASSFALTLPDAASDGTFTLRQAADGSTLLADTRGSATVSSGVTLTVTSGVTSSGLVVASGGTLAVLSGGTAVGATVLGQATLYGGVASGTTVSNGGMEIVSSGGVGVGETLSANASETVSAGGAVSGPTVSGGLLTISGGVASGTLVKSGSLTVSSGTATATTVASGGVENIYVGVTVGDVISGGYEFVITLLPGVSGSAVVSNALVESGGLQELYTGATVNATIAGGGDQVLMGGTASGTTVSNGGMQSLNSPATALNDTVLSGATVANSGTLLFNEAAGRTVTLGGIVVGPGAIVNSGAGTLVLSAITSQTFYGNLSGTTTIAGGTVELTSAGAAGTGSIGFAAGTSGTFRIDGPIAPANTISGLLQGDVIDFAGIAFSTGEAVALTSGNVLQVTSSGGPTESIQLDPSQGFSGEFFHLIADAGSGTAITNDTTACYAAGTLIATDRGEVAVERLAIGDPVLTVSGALVPVRWLGWRRVDLRRNRAAAPVRIAAHAFGAGLPRRDLLVSPEHAVFVDGILVPARHLLGCAGITVDTTLDATTYYHIELPQHDVVLAEGLPCESWLDTGNRAMFENAPVTALRFSESRGLTETGAYAAIVTAGPALDAVRRRLGTPRVQTAALLRPGAHEFALQPGTELVCLTTPAQHVPGDARLLGAAIAAIGIDGTAISLDDSQLAAGFHAAEAGWRWTDGAGYIAVSCDARTLAVTVSAIAGAARAA